MLIVELSGLLVCFDKSKVSETYFESEIHRLYIFMGFVVYTKNMAHK